MNFYSSSFSTKIGLKQTTASDSIEDRILTNLHKPSPIPIFRKDILNSCKLKERFQIKGHKLFAKLSISGPETKRILKDVEKSKTIKFVKSFEFDPYLCEHSYITDLRRVCHKIKRAKRINLTIRRMDTSDELEKLGPFMARFTRIESIRLEFPSTPDIGDNGLMELYKGISKCSFIKTLEWIHVNMPEPSQRLSNVGSIYLSRLRLLENIKVYSTLKKGAIRDEISHQPKKKSVKSSRIKSIDVAASATGQWANMGIEMDQTVKDIKKHLEIYPNFKIMKIKSMKIPANYDAFLIFFTVMSHFPSLQHLDWEFLNCQISDFELIAIAQGLPKVQQLKSFSLKVIQNSMLSEDCIEKVASVISRLDNFSKFDLYFSKLSLHPQAIKELGKRIESSGNVRCSCSKISLHIYKTNNESDSTMT